MGKDSTVQFEEQTMSGVDVADSATQQRFGLDSTTRKMAQKNSAGVVVPIGFLAWTAEKTGAYTAKDGEFVLCDPSGGVFQVDAPASPVNNQKFGVKNHTPSTNVITIDGNGKNFDGGASSLVIDVANEARVFQFSSVADEWLEIGG